MSGRTDKAQLILELRSLGVKEQAVLNAIERVPREAFVPESFRARAYDNSALPIESGQTISQPLIVAHMTEALEVTRRHRVLEIGTGSGYQAAVLARLARRVYTIERIKSLLEEAERRFANLGITNIVARHGDGYRGWPEAAPFPRIMVTAGAREVPQALADQLEEGGIMVIPVGRHGGDQDLLRLTRTADGFEERNLGPVRFVPLVAG